MPLCMAVLCAEVTKTLARIDSIQRLGEMLAAGNSQRRVIPSRQFRGEELQRLCRVNVSDALRFFTGVHPGTKTTADAATSNGYLLQCCMNTRIQS